jgi:amino acid adenylation domain-containing protein
MIETLIDKLIHHNIRLELVAEDKLKIHADIDKIPGDLLTEIRHRKEDLVKYLVAQYSFADFDHIPEVAPAESYTLSSTQRRLWILGQFKDSNAAYNIPRAYVFEGILDHTALTTAFDALITRHESLRTVFREDGEGGVKQFILLPEQINFRIVAHDMRNEAEQETLVHEQVKQAFITPFVLSKGPLLRADLFQVADNRWIFVYVMHHIISDGWSMGILFQELLALYGAFTRGENNPLTPLRIQYKDYAAWQQQQLSGTALENHKAYWLKHFEGELPVLELPGDKVRPAIKTYFGGVVRKFIAPEVAAGIKAFTLEQDSTLFMGLLAVVNALLYRYTYQEDIIIGTPIAGREHIDLENQIGFYVNTLALRTQFKGEESYRQLLERVRQVTLGAYEHQVFPFDELVDILNVSHDRSRNPLFDIQVTVQNAAESQTSTAPQPQAALSVNSYNNAANTGSVFDMVFNFIDTGNGIQVLINYNTDVIGEAMVTQMAGHIETLLAAIITHPDKPIRQLDFLAAADKAQLLTSFNNIPVTYPENETLVSLFAKQVAAVPDQVAVYFEGKTLTYEELDEKSSRLAHHLRTTYGVQPDELIGVMVDRSAEMIIAILGVMKAGGAYVPINTSYPRARKEFIISDTSTRILITQTTFLVDLDFYQGGLFAIDIQLDTLEAAPASPANTIQSTDLAYVIYTSGSTGEPKGVIIEHGAAACSIQAQQTIFEINRSDRSLQFCSASFDVSVFEIFLTLLSGASLYIIPDAVKNMPSDTATFIHENAITIASIPPAYLRLLDIEKISTLKKLVTGGESVTLDNVIAFSRYGTYYNAYGPTESSLCTSIYEVNRGRTATEGDIPIGRPIAGVQVYITDEFSNLVPAGVAGEICIAGTGLARGYLNSPDLTAEKFVADPFNPGKRIYKTGDIGRWQPDGNLVFIGRKDNQVKLHGYRIELGEIEKALQDYPAIDAAIVMVKSNQKGIPKLVAYLTTKDALHIVELRNYLNKILPAYMLPGNYVVLDSFPLTPNGKVERKELPDPEGLELLSGAEYMAPQTEMEEKMVKIWEEILGKEMIGVRDDYFELGGSSLKAMIVVKKMMDEMGVSLPIKILFEEKTIENIGKYLADKEQAVVPVSYDHSETSLLSDASFNQQSFFSEWNKKGDHLVISPYEFPELDVQALVSAIGLLVNRHEILRTRFVRRDGKIKQEVLPPAMLEQYITESVSRYTAAEIKEIIRKEHFREFDLFAAPLFRVNIYRLENGHYTVLLVIHHIITDGYSGGILKQELMALYQNRGEGLSPLSFQYRNYAAWQRSFVNSREGEKHQAYWLGKLKGFHPQLAFSLPAVPADPDKDDVIALNRIIAGELHDGIAKYTKTNGLTNTTLLMGVLILLLHKLSKQTDITVTTTVSGRNSKYYGALDVTGLIGFFANLLLVRNDINPELPVLEYLQQVQRHFLDDLHYDAYPFEKLINELPEVVPASFFNSTVSYNYHNYQYQHEIVRNTEILDSEESKSGEITMETAFVLAVTEFKNCLNTQFIFNKKQFSYAQRIFIKENYFSLLEQVLQQPQLSVADIHTKQDTCCKTGNLRCTHCKKQ